MTDTVKGMPRITKTDEFSEIWPHNLHLKIMGYGKLDTVNYANPTTETRMQVLELGPRY